MSDGRLLKNAESEEESTRNGFIAALTAYLIWGFLPIYFKQVSNVPAMEMLAHRIFWAVPFGGLIILIRGQLPEVKRVLMHKRTFFLLFLSASVVTINWYLYIFTIQRNDVFQASLGYYINPLMYVMVGVLFLGEKLQRLQVFAVAIAAVGVMVLTVSGGRFPSIAIALALAFTIYGVIRKQVNVGAMPGLFVETLLIFPFAAFYLGWLWKTNTAAFVSGNLSMLFEISLSGPLTVVPLLLFAIAARRLQLTTIGIMQFLAPSINFGVALYYGEILTRPHIICFSCIWIAMSLFVWDAWRQSRKIKGLRIAATDE